MSHSEEEKLTISCLMHAINDAQETIRGYDTKAEILAILLTLAVGLTNFSLLPHATACTKLMLIASWVTALISIVLLGLVLHPKSDPFKNIHLGNYSPKCIYFLRDVTSSPQHTVNNLAQKALDTNWVEELTYENMKLSLIREGKHYWFIFALRLTGLTILLIAGAIGMGAYNG